jgi:DNA mismatch endonuclease (patch repair protein)
MPDVFTKAKRSEVMSRIRGRGNQETELALMQVFRGMGITGWRRQVLLKVRSSRREEAHSEKREGKTRRRKSDGASSPRLLRVKVDFVFPRPKVAVFVDGCFWHGCPQHATKPRHNAAFWRKKLAGNKARDRRVTRTLRRAGWRVLRLWEHELARKRELRLAARLRCVLG